MATPVTSKPITETRGEISGHGYCRPRSTSGDQEERKRGGTSFWSAGQKALTPRRSGGRGSEPPSPSDAVTPILLPCYLPKNDRTKNAVANEAAAEREKINPRIKPLGQITTLIAPPQELDGEGKPLPLPPDYSAPFVAEATQTANFPPQNAAWRGEADATVDIDFCYRPLYFELARAERYGHTYGVLQPGVSVIDFYTTALFMPLLVTIRPPGQCELHPGRPWPGYPLTRQSLHGRAVYLRRRASEGRADALSAPISPTQARES